MSWLKNLIGSNSPQMKPVVPGGSSNKDERMRNLSLVRRRSTSESSVGSATSRSNHLNDFFDRAEEDDFADVPEEYVKHQQKSVDIKSLPEGFFRSDFDPVAHLLSELPEDVKSGDLVQHIQVKISDKDIEQDVVKENITDKILEKYETFLRGMRQIQEVDDDLRIASSHISEGTWCSSECSQKNVTTRTPTLEYRYEKRESFQGKTRERHAGDTVQETKTCTSWGFDEDVEIHSRYCEYGTKCGDVSEAGSVS